MMANAKGDFLWSRLSSIHDYDLHNLWSVSVRTLPELYALIPKPAQRMFSQKTREGSKRAGTWERGSSSTADELKEQAMQLLPCLLVKYLLNAASKPAVAAANNAVHLLPYLIEPQSLRSRSFHSASTRKILFSRKLHISIPRATK